MPIISAFVYHQQPTSIMNPRIVFSSSSKRIWSQLQHWMEHHPIAANSVLCFHLWVAGDALAQYSEHKIHTSNTNSSDPSLSSQSESKSDHSPNPSTSNSSSSSLSFHYYDPMRTLQCASYGALVTGPILATWYPYLETLCSRYNITARYGVWGAPILKVLADEFIMDPPTLVLFFSYMNFCENGGQWSTLQHKLRHEFWTAWCTSLVAWPPILLGAFRFLPTYAQAPVINACCIVWDGFLSHRNAVAKAKQEQQEKENDEQQTSKSSLEKEDRPNK